MSRVRLFQVMVVLSTAVYLVWYFSWYMPLPFASVEPAMRYLGHGSLPIYDNQVVSWLIFAAWIVAAVGLILFQPWARLLFAALTVWSVIEILTSGLFVQFPVQVALGRVNSLLDGAILTLAYLEPLSSAFRKSPNSTVERDARGTGARPSL